MVEVDCVCTTMSGALGTGMDSKHTAQHGIFGIPKGLDGGIVAGEFRGCGHGWGGRVGSPRGMASAQPVFREQQNPNLFPPRRLGQNSMIVTRIP